MAEFIDAVFAEKGINPTREHQERIRTKWLEIQQLKGDLSGIAVDDADISLRNIAGGDHLDR